MAVESGTKVPRLSSTKADGARMIGAKMYNTILTLWELGRSQREIAEQLGLSKTTVNKYCSMPEDMGMMHSYQRAGRSAFAIAEAYLRERLSLKPKLRASRLYEEIRELYPELQAKPRAFRSYLTNLSYT